MTNLTRGIQRDSMIVRQVDTTRAWASVKPALLVYHSFMLGY